MIYLKDGDIMNDNRFNSAPPRMRRRSNSPYGSTSQNEREMAKNTPDKRPPQNGRVRVKKSPIQLKYKSQFDYIILLCVLLLVAIGIIMVFSSSYYTAGRGENTNMYTYLIKDSIYAGLGIGVMFAFANINYEIIKKFVPFMYVITIVLLILVLTPLGVSHNGAKRWLKFGIEFQPSEIAKFTLITTLATVLESKPDIFKTPMGYAKYMLIALVLIAPIALENLSTAIVLGGITVVLMFVASRNLIYPLGTSFVGAGGAIFSALLSWRSDRIKAWIHPEAFNEGTGYQVLQSLYSVASGGLLGLGLGGSRQKLGYMPEAQNDIIFAIICEELGWFGAVFIVTLFIIVVWRGISLAIRNVKEPFAMYMSLGITSMIAIQVIINIAVVTNTIPNTGIPLPFISYGGTSIVMMLACIGILLNISRYHGKQQ